MKKILAILIISILITACSPKATTLVGESMATQAIIITGSSTPIPYTATPLPTLTKTSQPTPSPTQTSTVTPTKTPDVTTLGNPSTPLVEYPSKLPQGFFTYNTSDQYVYEKSLHGRPVAVVFEKSTLFSEAERTELTDYIFNTWLYFWDIFGGYRTQQFLIRFGDQPNTEGETSVGFTVQEQWLINEKNGVPESDWFQPLAHGIFHAWNGTMIKDASCGEKWFVEGVTQYYGDRQATRRRYMFDTNQYLLYYKELVGTPKDISLVDAGFRFCDTTSRDRLFYYRKGFLVVYLMDIEIAKQGHSLDELMRYMYEEHGVTGKYYTTDDVKQALEVITNQSWDTFFDDYIYGTAPLPINDVKFLEK